MRFHRSLVIVSLAILMASVVRTEAKKPKTAAGSDVPASAAGRILGPAEIFDRLEKSKVKYTFHDLSDLRDVTPDRFAERLWPQQLEPLSQPYLMSEHGDARKLAPYPIAEGAATALDQAEAAFEAKHYEQAVSAYQDVIEKYPTYYLAHLYLGDAYFQLGRYEDALECYRKGIELNPWAYSGYAFQGHALVRLGRRDEARASWTHALALRPNQPFVLKLLGVYANDLEVDVDESRFEPKAFVRSEEGGVGIYVPMDSVHWLSWAACKALWLGEPGYRREKGLEDGAGNWSTKEDNECLANLMASYAVRREDGTTPPDPALDRLTRIGRDGQLQGFILYEIGSRIAPDVALLAEPGVELLEDYVSRYVVVRRESAPSRP